MNKHKLSGLLAVFALILSMASVSAQQSPANVAITLERTACYGSCPIYSLTILEDGTVTYEGEGFVAVMGEQISQLDPKTVALMVEAFENAGYFDWDEVYYTQTVTDLPSVITSVTHNGKTHQIRRYTGATAPLALPYLELWIDQMSSSVLWTGVQPDIIAIFNGEQRPLITFERQACFGNCPVYAVALYEDGTGVFTGIANVKVIGVQTFSADALEVGSVVRKAQAFGYFDWQDAYQHQVMTDQATIITSIQSADRYKEIIRYDGDPNAPIGLVRIEDSIVQFVTDLVG